MDIAAQRAAIAAEGLTWAKAKTPYHHSAHIKGAGATCSSMFVESFNAILGTSIIVPDHSEQWYMNQLGTEFYLDELKAAGFVEIQNSEVQIADLVLTKTRYRSYCHGALITNWPKPPSIVHVTTRGCEAVHNLHSSWYFSMRPDEHKFLSWGGWH
jgi:hypothetical protein